MTIKTLSKDDILKLHKDLINAYGGTHGVRDDALFDSAVNAPFQSFGGVDLYQSIEEKAARLGFGLAATIPFTMGINESVHTPCWLSLPSTALIWTVPPKSLVTSSSQCGWLIQRS